MTRDLFMTPLLMSEEPERLPLADLWPEDRADPNRSGIPLMSGRKAAKPVSDGPQCSRCAGELVRSRIRVYERFLTFFASTRPYRCLDCRARRWQ